MKLSTISNLLSLLLGSGRLPWDDNVSRACLALVAVSVALVLPTGADAKPGYELHPGGIRWILPVEQTDDYVVAASASDQQQVQLSASGVSGSLEEPSTETEYSIKGRASSKRLEADFGVLGQINVRLLNLRALPADPRHRGRCKGRAPLVQRGTYRGTIKFSREGDVPKVSVKRGPVYIEHHFRQVCKRWRLQSKPGGKRKRETEEGLFKVSGKGEGRTVVLEARIFALKPNPAWSGGVVSVAAYERLGGVRITRKMGDFFGHNSLVMSRRGKALETVRVEPPEPFAGQALYSHSPGPPPSWTGDLSVDLPGADGVPLTGPGFNAALPCRGNVDDCLYGIS